MKKNEWIERFNGHIDELLEHGDVSQSAKEVSVEYAEMITLVEMLSSTDFSHQSQVRHSLRRRLLTGSDPREGWQITENNSMISHFQKKPLAVVWPAVILAALVIMTLFWPSGVRAAVQGALSFFEQLWIGESTSVVPIDPGEITITEGGLLTMPGRIADESEGSAGRNTYGEAGSYEIEVSYFNSFDECQDAAPFALRQPRYLPQDYTFSKASVWGNRHVNLVYTGPDGDLLFIQRPVGELPGQSVSIGLPDDYVVESVQVNGQDAVWAEHVLLWEDDGYSYLLSSPTLSQLEAVRFAESLN